MQMGRSTLCAHLTDSPISCSARSRGRRHALSAQRQVPHRQRDHQDRAQGEQLTVSELLTDSELEEALQYRGVTRDVDAGLSMEQQSALLILTDPHDNRTTAQKMKAMHVPMPRYQAWMKQPLFSSMYRKRMEDQFGEEGISVALRAILSGAEKGDVNSAMKLLEITGRYNPAQQQLEDVKVILVRMMEAIIKHADKDTRIAILADLEAETTSYALLNSAVQQRQIEGT
jgi:hypothetical protein